MMSGRPDSTRAHHPRPAGVELLSKAEQVYDQILRGAAGLTGRTLKTLYIVGGGSANTLLNQLSADATGLEVVAGPIEATALGNAAVQAVACGDLAGLAEARAVIAASAEPKRYEPSGDSGVREQYAAARERFAKLAQ